MQSRKKQIFFFLLLALALGLAAFVFGGRKTQSVTETMEHTPLKEGSILPYGVRLPKIGGGEDDLSDYKGRVILLNFWAAWCTPCVHEMPSIYRLQKKMQGKEFIAIGLSMDDNPEQGLLSLERLIGKAGIPMYSGLNNPLVERFSMEGLPYSVIVDREGKIRYARPGELDWSNAETIKLIESYL